MQKFLALPSLVHIFDFHIKNTGGVTNATTDYARGLDGLGEGDDQVEEVNRQRKDVVRDARVFQSVKQEGKEDGLEAPGLKNPDRVRVAPPRRRRDAERGPERVVGLELPGRLDAVGSRGKKKKGKTQRHRMRSHCSNAESILKKWPKRSPVVKPCENI
jgi:hypothetical protein